MLQREVVTNAAFGPNCAASDSDDLVTASFLLRSDPGSVAKYEYSDLALPLLVRSDPKSLIPLVETYRDTRVGLDSLEGGVAAAVVGLLGSQHLEVQLAAASYLGRCSIKELNPAVLPALFSTFVRTDPRDRVSRYKFRQAFDGCCFATYDGMGLDRGVERLWEAFGDAWASLGNQDTSTWGRALQYGVDSGSWRNVDLADLFNLMIHRSESVPGGIVTVSTVIAADLCRGGQVVGSREALVGTALLHTRRMEEGREVTADTMIHSSSVAGIIGGLGRTAKQQGLVPYLSQRVLDTTLDPRLRSKSGFALASIATELSDLQEGVVETLVNLAAPPITPFARPSNLPDRAALIALNILYQRSQLYPILSPAHKAAIRSVFNRPVLVFAIGTVEGDEAE